MTRPCFSSKLRNSEAVTDDVDRNSSVSSNLASDRNCLKLSGGRGLIQARECISNGSTVLHHNTPSPATLRMGLANATAVSGQNDLSLRLLKHMCERGANDAPEGPKGARHKG